MAVQHDEGFLYIRLETAAAVDFSKGHYLIGLDTCSGGAGERLLPFETNLRSPAGLTFLVHLAGKKRSRILVSASYDRYLNAVLGKIVPTQSDTGAWVIMQNQTNRRRISKDGQRFFPCRVATMSRLRFGCLDRVKTAYDSLADFYYEGNAVELRIPWSLINFTDPSSKQVLWKDKDGMTRKTEGIGLLAVSYKPAGVGLTAAATGRRANHTDCFPAVFQDNRIRTYTWHGWNTPVYHTFLKESYYHYGRVLAELGDTP